MNTARSIRRIHADLSRVIADLKAGEPLDLDALRMARRRLDELVHMIAERLAE